MFCVSTSEKNTQKTGSRENLINCQRNGDDFSPLTWVVQGGAFYEHMLPFLLRVNYLNILQSVKKSTVLVFFSTYLKIQVQYWTPRNIEIMQTGQQQSEQYNFSITYRLWSIIYFLLHSTYVHTNIYTLTIKEYCQLVFATTSEGPWNQTHVS
jgi:hypothetical protein